MTMVAALGLGPLGSFLKPKQVCHNNKSCLECMWQRNFSLFYIFRIYPLFFNVQLNNKFAKHFDLGHCSLHIEILSNYGNYI